MSSFVLGLGIGASSQRQSHHQVLSERWEESLSAIRFSLSPLMWWSSCRWPMCVSHRPSPVEHTLLGIHAVEQQQSKWLDPSAQLWPLNTESWALASMPSKNRDMVTLTALHKHTIIFSCPAGLLLQWTSLSVGFLPSEISREKVNGIPQFLSPAP